jgi:hypothetical protein
MCSPILGLAVGILQSVVQFQAAQQDYEAQSQQWRQNYTNSLAAARDEQLALTQRQLQEEEATSEQIHLMGIEGAEKVAEARVAAGAAGVSGISVGNIIADIRGRTAGNQVTAQRNWRMTAQQLQLEQNATVTRAENRINSVTRPTAPNPLSLVVGIAGAGVRAYGQM